jgi:hypothetical protein
VNTIQNKNIAHFFAIKMLACRWKRISYGYYVLRSRVALRKYNVDLNRKFDNIAHEIEFRAVSVIRCCEIISPGPWSDNNMERAKIV